MNAKMICSTTILIQAAHKLCDYLDVAIWVWHGIVCECDCVHWGSSCSIEFCWLSSEHENLIVVLRHWHVPNLGDLHVKENQTGC